MRIRGLFVVLLGLVTALVLMTPGFASQNDGKRSPALAAQAAQMPPGANANNDKSNRPQSSTPCVRGMAGIYPCKNIDLMSQVTRAELGLSFVNDTWGWTDPETKLEIAIVGGTEGTVFVDITDPKRPEVLGILPAHTLDPAFPFWRDMKVYSNHVYVVSEQTGHGLQVFDLTELRNDPPGYTVYPETAHYAGFSWAHNININEETGFAYVVGSSTCDGGLHMVDITTPDSPTFAGCFSEHGYIHDTQCVIYQGPDADWTGREICFNSNAEPDSSDPDGTRNALSIVDVTDKANPVVIAREEYARDGHSHQGWLTPDHQYFPHGDELDELSHGLRTTTRVWDVRDLDNPFVSLEWQNDTTSIDHNMYTEGRYVFQANYTTGLRVLDASKIGQPALSEVGFFDVYPENDDPTFEGGAWSNYPYFRQNKIVAVSSIDRGLFVLRPRGLGGT